MIISFVVAVANNNVIGKENDLPWHIPEDLKRFRKITEGGTVLMGRKTFESIMNRLGKPLPNRANVVLTRNKNYQVPEGVLVFNSPEDALENLDVDELFVLGGGGIFKIFADKAEKIYMTRIDKEIPDADAFFPEINLKNWKEVRREDYEGYSFVDYLKK